MFKNLTAYKLTEKFEHTSQDLIDDMENYQFKDCAKSSLSSIGWIPPLKNGELVQEIHGYMMIALRKDEKILPSSVINEILLEKIDDLETKEERKASSKEKKKLKEEIIFDLLPKAFIKTTRMLGYIDVRHGFIIIDSSSPAKAEEMVSLLRKGLKSFPTSPLAVKLDPKQVMTTWLKNKEHPVNFHVEDECELKSTDEEGGSVKCKNIDLFSDQVDIHLETGKEVIKLCLTWSDQITFMTDATLGVKRIKFTDASREEAEETDIESAEQQFDADFTIMAGLFTDLILDLSDSFDGLTV